MNLDYECIINSITSREKVTLSVLFQCGWLNILYTYVFLCFFPETKNDYFLQFSL